MSELRVLERPTLGLLLSNPQNQESFHVEPEKIKFPKINTKLKKTHFTKYHSAFISAKSCDIYQKSQPNEVLSYQSFINKVKQSPRKESEKKKQKRSHEVNQKVWRLNQKHNKSYSVRSPQRLSQSRILCQSGLQQYQQNNKILYEQSKEKQESNQVPRFSLLTQIRDLNISPIHYSETQRQQKQYLRKSEQINESIQRSNHVISLIQKNYKKGFFNDHLKEQKKFSQLQQKLGLFAYLKRDFVTKKQTLSPQKVAQYFKRPSNKKLQAKINLQARSFLKDKLHNDYRSHNQVEKLRGDLSQRAIEQGKSLCQFQEIMSKNNAFHKQYRKKYNIPYMSFLSLPKHLKVKVLQNLTQQPKQRQNR